MKKSKILLFDIETAPNLSWTWGKWEQNVIEFDREWYMLTFAAKWYGDAKVVGYSLPDFSLYKKDRENDRELVRKLWELFNEAEIIIAHNGDAFDIKKTNARFIYHGFTPPSEYKTIDTKKIAKKYFKFESNKLDDLGNNFKLGRKIDTGGFELWKGCMSGDKKAWRDMLRYNKQDVVLLEKVYDKLKGWMTNHPNMNHIENTFDNCKNCKSKNIIKRGTRTYNHQAYQRYQCQECGVWMRANTKGVLV